MTTTQVHTSTHDARRERVLGTGLVLAALVTAVGSLWLITGPAAAEPGSHPHGQHVRHVQQVQNVQNVSGR